MHDPAFVALACSLGPVAYVLAAFVTGLLLVKTIDRKLDQPGNTFFVGLLSLAWPATLFALGIGGLGAAAVSVGKGGKA